MVWVVFSGGLPRKVETVIAANGGQRHIKPYRLGCHDGI